MVSSNGLQTSFDSLSFWQEVNPVLLRGGQEMLNSATDKHELLESYNRMDKSLAELVERYDPPENARMRLLARINDKIELLKRRLKKEEIDGSRYFEEGMTKTCVLVLKALGKTRRRVVAIDRLMDDAAAALCEGNFTEQGAKQLLTDMSLKSPKDFRGMLSGLSDKPREMEFLRLLVKKGVPKARMMAEETMSKMMPKIESVRFARQEAPKMAVVIPIRPLRQS